MKIPFLISPALVVTLLGVSAMTLPAQNLIGGKARAETDIPALQRNSMLSCDTVFSFPTIDQWPSGLAFDGSHLWSVGYATSQIYKFDMTGNLVKTLPHPSMNTYHGGDLDFDGTHLWMVCEQDGIVYQVDTANGNVITQFTLPTSNPSDPNNFGCAFDAGYLWISEYLDGTLMRLDLNTGAVIDSFVTGLQLLPLKLINNELYGIANVTGAPLLVHFDKNTGAVLNSFPWCLTYPLGVCHSLNSWWGLQSTSGSCRAYRFEGSFTGLPETEFNGINIYPNPASAEFTVWVMPDHYPVTMSVTDLSGKCIRKENLLTGELTVSISDFAAGLYFIRFDQGNRVQMQKLVVARP